MMKQITVALLLVSLAVHAQGQDTPKRDPLHGHYILANSAEVVHLTESQATTPMLRHDLHDFLANGQAGGPGTGGNDDSLDITADRRMDYVAADVNGDGKDELVVARASATGTLEISVSSASKVSGLDWTWDETTVLQCPWDTVQGQIRVIAAQLDWTPREEIVVYFWQQQSLYFHIRVYDSIDAVTHLPVQAASYSFRNSEMKYFDVAAADFDHDGLDEILEVSHEGASTWHSLVFRMLDYNPEQKTIQRWPTRGWEMDAVPWSSRLRLKVTAGDFRNRGQVDAVVSATATSGTTGRQVYKYVTVLPSSQNYSIDLPFTLENYPSGATYGTGYETHAVSADLNPMKQDGDELVVAGPGELAVLKFDASLIPCYLAKVTLSGLGFYHPYEQRKFVAVADINADTAETSWTPEVVLAEHNKSDSSTMFRVYAVTRNAKDSVVGLTQLYANASGSPRSPVSELIIGDFDGDAIRTAQPTLLSMKAFLQPIVTLNIPPTHFDSLNGRVYDVCKAYGSNTSRFRAKYTQTQSQTSHFSSELGVSWGVSAKVGAGAEAYGVKVKASMGASYGEGAYGAISSRHHHHGERGADDRQPTTGHWQRLPITTSGNIPVYINGAHLNSDALIQIPSFFLDTMAPDKGPRGSRLACRPRSGDLLPTQPQPPTRTGRGAISLPTSQR